MSLRVAHFLVLLPLCITITGCNAGRISEENSRLRRENLEQADKLIAQDQQLLRLQGQIDGLTTQQNAQVKGVPGVKASDIPVATRITFGSYSGALDEDSDGHDDTIRVYVLTEDQKGRFIPVAGKAVLQIVAIEADNGVKELVRQVYEPKLFDEAYTTGLTGTHYTLEATLNASALAGRQSVTAKVTFTDAATGASLTHQAAIQLK